MPIILDLIIVLIICIFVFLSAKKGFVRTLIEVIGFVAAIVVALSISAPVASFCYDTAVEPIITKTVENSINETISNTGDAVDTLWNKLPSFLTESSFINLSKNDLYSASSNQTDIAVSVNSFLKPAICKILSAVISVILVVALLFVVRILAKLINKLFSFSIVGNINKTLGGILGLLKGFAVAVIFCMFVSLILSFTKNGFLIFTYDTINSSYIFKFLMELSPFI